MRKLYAACVAAAVGLSLGITPVHAGEIDILVKKLVEKGILTADEAREIVTETENEMRAQTAAVEKKETLPAWVQNTKLKGDLRLRFQNEHTKTAGSQPEDRARGRMRLRLGLESKVNEKITVGVGVATGTTSDARSTNQTLQDSFNKKPIILDYAYAQYAPFAWVALTGGKFKIPFWEPGDMIWDTDITPEGAALNFNKRLLGLDWFLNTGFFVIDESGSDADDPVMLSIQPGFKADITDAVSLKAAVAYQDALNVKGRVLDGRASSNTGSDTALAYDYDMLWPSVELSLDRPFRALGVPLVDIPHLAFFGEYVVNVNGAVKDEKDGFIVGAKFGAKRVAAFGDWQAGYNYVMLEKDAVLDILPDSDRNGGRTGSRGHEAFLDFGVGKDTWIGLDVYRAWNLAKGSSKRYGTLVEVDWNMRY